MEVEIVRESLNNLLRMYFRTCNEIYKELGIDKLSKKQFENLKLINEDDKITFGKLAELLHLSKPTVTEMINNFIKNGLAYRLQSDVDKRVYYIRLTEKGKKIATSNELESYRTAEKIIEKLDDKQILDFVKMFEKLVEV